MDFLCEFSQEVIDDCCERRPCRQKCNRCNRPVSCCICSQLPPMPVSLKKTKIIILQHPNEEKRPLNTVALLRACLNKDDCMVLRSKKFPVTRFPHLHQVLSKENTFLLFPEKTARDVAEVGKLDFDSFNFVLLDGTWKQAEAIYAQNKFLRKVPKMIINEKVVSEYVIRTQPTDQCLSTIECAATALSYTEGNDMKEMLLKPLRELCQIQLNNGAVKHESKEAVKKQQQCRQ